MGLTGKRRTASSDEDSHFPAFYDDGLEILDTIVDERVLVRM